MFDFRRRYVNEWPSDWSNTRAFCEAVGPLPGPRYILRKLDPSVPLSKENIGWFPPAPTTIRSRDDQSAYARQMNQIRKYGLLPADYQAMWDNQGGRCAICQIHESEIQGRWPGKLYVDHDHETGAVRGLLCLLCNFGIGALTDDRLIAAIVYLAERDPEKIKALAGDLVASIA